MPPPVMTFLELLTIPMMPLHGFECHEHGLLLEKPAVPRIRASLFSGKEWETCAMLPGFRVLLQRSLPSPRTGPLCSETPGRVSPCNSRGPLTSNFVVTLTLFPCKGFWRFTKNIVRASLLVSFMKIRCYFGLPWISKQLKV